MVTKVHSCRTPRNRSPFEIPVICAMRVSSAPRDSRALELDPSNVNARAKLQEVKSRTWQLTAAAAVFVVGVSGAWFLLSRLKRSRASGPSSE